MITAKDIEAAIDLYIVGRHAERNRNLVRMITSMKIRLLLMWLKDLAMLISCVLKKKWLKLDKLRLNSNKL